MITLLEEVVQAHGARNNWARFLSLGVLED